MEISELVEKTDSLEKKIKMVLAVALAAVDALPEDRAAVFGAALKKHLEKID